MHIVCALAECVVFPRAWCVVCALHLCRVKTIALGGCPKARFCCLLTNFQPVSRLFSWTDKCMHAAPWFTIYDGVMKCPDRSYGLVAFVQFG